jgi:hypothetical protein
MKVLRFVGWGLVGLIVGELIYAVGTAVVSETVVLTAGGPAWWHFRASYGPLFGVWALACLGIGLRLLWARMTGTSKQRTL